MRPQHQVTSLLTYSGLGLTSLHGWVSSTTPVPFQLYKPINLAPFIITPLFLAAIIYGAWQGRAFLVPIATSRVVWGVGCVSTCILFTSGYMWNKIKNAPYVQGGSNGQISWVASGYSNQLGLETQVVGGMCKSALWARLMIDGLLALTVIVLSVFIPAQSSPVKQRVGTLLWIGLLVVVYSMLIRLFKVKNGGYPFKLL